MSCGGKKIFDVCNLRGESAHGGRDRWEQSIKEKGWLAVRKKARDCRDQQKGKFKGDQEKRGWSRGLAPLSNLDSQRQGK